VEASESASEQQIPQESRGRRSGHVLECLHLLRRGRAHDVSPPEQRERAPAGKLQSLRQHLLQCARIITLHALTVLCLYGTSARLPRTPFRGSANGVQGARKPRPLIREMDVVWLMFHNVIHGNFSHSSSKIST